MQNSKVYEEIKRLSLSHIKAYHADLLEYDRDVLNEYPTTPCIHCTGENGTYMFSQTHGKEWLENLPQMEDFRDKIILYFDGDKVETINLDKAFEIVKTWF